MQQIDYEKNSQIFKALAHPIRLQMVDVLLDDECCVTDVVNALGYFSVNIFSASFNTKKQWYCIS